MRITFLLNTTQQMRLTYSLKYEMVQCLCVYYLRLLHSQQWEKRLLHIYLRVPTSHGFHLCGWANLTQDSAFFPRVLLPSYYWLGVGGEREVGSEADEIPTLRVVQLLCTICVQLVAGWWVDPAWEREVVALFPGGWRNPDTHGGATLTDL